MKEGILALAFCFALLSLNDYSESGNISALVLAIMCVVIMVANLYFIPSLDTEMETDLE